MIRARFALALALALLAVLPLASVGHASATDAEYSVREMPAPPGTPAVTDAEFSATQTPPAPTFTVESPAPVETQVPAPIPALGPEATAEVISPDPALSPTPPATRAPIPEGDMPAPEAELDNLAIVTDPQGTSLFGMPSTEAPILAELEPGQVLDLVILGVTWSQVRAGAETGWVPTYALGFSFGSPQPGIAVVTAPGGRLTLRSGMSTRTDALGTVGSGHAVLLLAKSEAFSLVRFEGREGYVLTQHLREEFPGRNLGTLVPVVSVDPAREANVRLRAEPGRQAVVYTTVPSGNHVVVLERGNGWARVEWEGHSGYMMEDYLGSID